MQSHAMISEGEGRCVVWEVCQSSSVAVMDVGDGLGVDLDLGFGLRDLGGGSTVSRLEEMFWRRSLRT